ncbi:putative casparian strip membrane protein [Dioscorea sansibarensis]
MDGKTVPAEMGIQMPGSKQTDTVTMGGPLMPGQRSPMMNSRSRDMMGFVVRAACFASSLVSLCLMVTAEQHGEIELYGLQLPLHSKWSFSDSLEYLVGISAAVAAHSVLQLALSGRRMLKRAPVIPSRSHAWALFAGDQVFAYAMISAGSAAAGVTNLNRTGIRHSALPDFCKPLHRFCDRMAISLTFAFLSCLFLAISAVLDVLWLSNY